MVEAIEAKKAGNFTYGMIGGGPGSFIGVVHRAAIGMGGSARLAAGCFSQDYEKSLETGRMLGVAEDRIYRTYEEMAKCEGAREDRPDFMVVTVPNVDHYGACRAFLEQGFHVMCEKPLACSTQEALELERLAKEHGCLFAVSYVYTGHLMAKEARQLIRDGVIGDIRVVVAEYPQEWLIDLVEGESKQASWRTDPARSGISNCVGDIGSHIENMVAYMTGLKIAKLCANLDVIGEGRTLDTNAEILLKYTNGASGCYWCSQIAAGYDNALKVRVFGTLGAIEFEQEKSIYLTLTLKGEPPRLISRGNGYIHDSVKAYNRLPSGHPEGYHEALANIYDQFMLAIAAKRAGEDVCEADYDYPGIEMGIDGVRFIEKCVESSQNDSSWVNL